MASTKTATTIEEATVTKTDVGTTEVKTDAISLKQALNKIQSDSQESPESYLKTVVVPDGGE